MTARPGSRARRIALGLDKDDVYQPTLRGAELMSVINALHMRADDYEKSAKDTDPVAFADLVEHDRGEAKRCRALADRLQDMRLARCRP